MGSLRKIALATAVATSIAFIGGCATNPQTGQVGLPPSITKKFNSVFNNPDPCASNNLHAGVALGALGGAALGYIQQGDAKGALIGAVAGATIGGLIGHQLDKRRCEIYKIAKANNLKVMSTKITAQDLEQETKAQANKADIGLDVQIQNNANDFVPGTAQLTPTSRRYLTQIAKLYSPQELAASLPANATPEQKAQLLNRKILIVGHVDQNDAASGVDLAKLSEERARVVAQLFAENGVPAENINYQGAGTMLPLASNASEQGRKNNARIQIVDVPNEQTLKQFAKNRKANPADFIRARIVPDNPIAKTKRADDHTKSSSKREHAPSSRKATVAPAPKDKRAPSSKSAAITSASNYGFGGTPLNGNYKVNLGVAPRKSTFSFISSAYADTPVVVDSCLNDRPRNATPIKNLGTGKVLVINDAIPGLYGQPWIGSHGQSSIALLRVYAPMDAGAPVPPVTVEFYKRDKTGKLGKHPLYVAKDSPVNVYRGTEATLYRVFVNGPAQCIDLYVPKRAATGQGLLIYSEAGRVFKSAGRYKSLD